MAYNNAWANHRLLRAVGRLSHDDFVATRTSFFPSLSVAPPQLDEFFCAGEAHLRAADLAELGYSEAMIWGQAP